jgi:tripartite-type tricarboxylate transporter receptor subunit TctC
MKVFSVLLSTTFLLGTASAQEAPYPSKPIVLMVPFAAGGGSDILARLVASGMSTRLGQPIVVDNRPGGSTGVAAGMVARAKPDGYTLLLGNSGTFVVNSLLNVKTNYVPEDLAVLGMVANFPMVYVVSNNSPIKSMSELVAAAKRSPGQLAYASPGTGSPHHLGMESLKYRAGIDMVHAPYRGVSPAFPDILSERVTVMFTDYAAATGLIKDGKLRPLAVGSRERSSFLPDVPTMQSLGYADFQLTGWQGMAVPAGTPPQIVNKLVAALRDTLADPETQKRLRDTGLEPNFLDPAAFSQYLAREREQLGTLIKSNKITIE